LTFGVHVVFTKNYNHFLWKEEQVHVAKGQDSTPECLGAD